MKYAIVGGDMRFAHLEKLLNESGRHAAGFFLEKAGADARDARELRGFDAIIANWPMRFPLASAEPTAAEILENIASGSALLLCGPKFPGEKRWDLQYVNLWADEALLTENAYLTAEGAVAAAMRVGGIRLKGASCAVIGYGRIGRALTEILVHLGANVTVISRSPEKRSEIGEAGARFADESEIGGAIADRSFIFSTPPTPVLCADELSFADKSARIIDLASPPYGVDLDAARSLGLQAWRENGLPGRYCPLSAARALLGAVLRWEEAELNGKH